VGEGSSSVVGPSSTSSGKDAYQGAPGMVLAVAFGSRHCSQPPPAITGASDSR
jgi:hypothetical protein